MSTRFFPSALLGVACLLGGAAALAWMREPSSLHTQSTALRASADGLLVQEDVATAVESPSPRVSAVEPGLAPGQRSGVPLMLGDLHAEPSMIPLPDDGVPPEPPVHDANSATHYANSDTHYETTQYHFQNSDTHSHPSDTHYKNTDNHWTDSSFHRYKVSDTHYPPSDLHEEETITHFVNSDTHKGGSSHHMGGSASHIAVSDFHQVGSTFSSSEPGEDDCPDGAPGPNQGDVELAGGGALLHINPQTHFVWKDEVPVSFTHRIVTYDTPRARSLHGHFKVEVESGSPDVVQVIHGGSNYAYGTPIHVVQHGHSGCGVHTWHGGTESIVLKLMEPGQVTLKVSVDPLPEPEGDGEPRESVYIVVDIPEFREEWEITSKAFIHCGVVWAPGVPTRYFGGDDRGPSLEGGLNWNNDLGSRAAIQGRVTLRHDENYIQGTPWMQFGETREYHSAYVQAGGTLPGCVFALAPGATPLAVATQTDTLMFEHLGGSSPATAAEQGDFKAYVDGPHPMIPLTQVAGEIKQSFNVSLRECVGHSWYRVWGFHSNFPAHELYLDSLELHVHMPVLGGPLPEIFFESSIPDSGWKQIN